MNLYFINWEPNPTIIDPGEYNLYYGFIYVVFLLLLVCAYLYDKKKSNIHMLVLKFDSPIISEKYKDKIYDTTIGINNIEKIDSKTIAVTYYAEQIDSKTIVASFKKIGIETRISSEERKTIHFLRKYPKSIAIVLIGILFIVYQLKSNNVIPSFTNIAFTHKIELRWYSSLWIVGLVSAYLIVQKLYKQQNIKDEKFEPLFFYCFLGILVGARLGHCIFYEPEYYLTNIKRFTEIVIPIHEMQDGSKVFVGLQGLASHGGTIGIIFMMMLYAHNMKMKAFTVIDNVALAVPIVACCIRLGNLMNSEIIGNVTDVPWAFIFHSNEALVNGQLAPRHPAQLYEAIAYLIIFFIQYYIYKKHDFPLYSQSEKKQGGVFVAKNKKNSATAVVDEAEKKSFIGKGFYFGFTIATIFFFRFFVEFIKKEQVDFEKGMALDMGQLLSIPFVLLGSWLIWNAIRKAKK